MSVEPFIHGETLGDVLVHLRASVLTSFADCLVSHVGVLNVAVVGSVELRAMY